VSGAEINTQVPTALSKDEKYNLISCLVDSAGWNLGIAFFSTSTMAPAFLSRLGAGGFVVGLLPAFVSIGYNVPGIFVANHIVRLSRARSWLFPVALMERIPLLLMGVTALTVHSPQVLVMLFLALYAIHSVLLGLNQPAYWVMIAKSVPMAWRGRLYGYAGLVGGCLGFAVLPITNHFLSHSGASLIHGFGWCFIIGASIEFCSCLPLAFVREPETDQMKTKDIQELPSGSKLLTIWRSSVDFRQFIWGQVFFSVWMIATPFYLLDGVRRFHVTGVQSGIYASIAVVVIAFGGSVCGMLSDIKGNRLILILSSVAGLFASAYAFVVPNAALLSIVFGLSAFGIAGAGLAGYNVTMEFAPTEKDVSHYTCFYNLSVSPIRAVSLIAGGMISQRFSCSSVFAISAIAAAISFLVTLRLVEPRHSNIGGRIEEPQI
jgi:MFS family permease